MYSFFDIYLNLLYSVEIIVDTEEPESISLNIEVLDFVHSSNLKCRIKSDRMNSSLPL